MEHNHSFIDTLEYGCTLVRAGIIGVRTADAAADHLLPKFALAARSALTTAAIGAGVGLLAAGMGQDRKRAVRTAFTFAGISFCADFCLRSQAVSRKVLTAVRKEVSDVSDQHWLQQNPVDYA